MGDDHEEFTDFAAMCGKRLFRTAYLLAGDRHTAEDITQTALGKLFTAWSRVRRADNPVAYAHTVLVRTYIASNRRRKREVPVERVTDEGYVDRDAVLRLTLLDALRQLPGRDRAIVVLRYWEDRTVAETAAVVGMRENAVRVRAMRALTTLRGLLNGANEVAER